MPAPDPAVVAKACAAAKAQGPLRWFHDDYDAALACARAAQKPLFIDAWAPWCHTCLSMDQTVLLDPSLKPLADRFVWLDVDTDKAVNANIVGKLQPDVWPTFYVLAPEDESVQARYLGAASTTQFREFLRQGESAYLDGKRGTLDPGSPLALMREGDRAIVAGDLDTAVRAYRGALAAAPPEWPRRPELLVALISALYDTKDWTGCVELAHKHLAQTGRSASTADFAAHANQCAERVPEGDGRRLREQLSDRLTAVIADADAPMSVDDRSDAMRILREIRESLGDTAGALDLAERQRALLDKAVAEAPSAFAAMTHNWPRSEVYVYLDKGEELIPDLKKSVEALPNEYDPLYRLAWVYYKTEAYEKALHAAQRSVELAYGPRKAHVQNLVAEIHRARGDREAEIEARAAVVATYESLPAQVQQTRDLLRARQALSEAQSAGNKSATDD